MTERPLRLLFLLLTLSLFVPFALKGREAPRKEESAAFLRYTAGMVLLRVRGEPAREGVYRISDGMTVEGVMKMTVAENRHYAGDSGFLAKRLQNGDVLTVIPHGEKQYVISLCSMRAAEKVAFGIPLHPDSLDYEDWLSLPGIGPKLAELIVADRQLNGAFGSLQGVQRVAGIGKGKLEIIKKYF